MDGLLKQNGEVVDDSIAATDLLKELRRGTKKHAAEVLSLAIGEDCRERGCFASTGPEKPSAKLHGKRQGSEGEYA